MSHHTRHRVKELHRAAVFGVRGFLALRGDLPPVTSLRRLTTLCSLAGLPAPQQLAYDLETAGSEAERNDMVQYFAENFDGFAPTEHGWVQSSRQLWVNPDCGLKTRAYKETKASIESLVAATEAVRASLTVAV